MNKRLPTPLFASVSLLAVLALSGCANTNTVFGDKNNKNPAYEAAMNVATDAQKKGDLQNAAIFYDRASKAAPGEAAPMIALGDVLWQAKNPSESARVLEAARKVDPYNDNLLRSLGRAYVGLNEPKKAQEAYLTALGIDSNNARTLSGLGIAYDLEGDHATAQSHYRSGLALTPDDGDLKNNLAYSLISTRNYQGAVDVLEPLLREGSATKRHRMNLALAYGLLGRDDDARSVASADLTPAAIERNLKVYRQLRNEPAPSRTMASIGKPSYTPGISKPAPVPAPAPVETVAAVEPPPAPPTPAENEIVLGQASAPTEISVPVVRTPAPAAPVVKAHTTTLAPAPAPATVPSSSPMPLASASVAAVAGVTAPPAQQQTQSPASALAAPSSGGLDKGKIFLGKFGNEASAREAWIRVWTNNSTTLSNLIASIEPQGGEVALFAVGAGSAEQADGVCSNLRQSGVSCGVTN